MAVIPGGARRRLWTIDGYRVDTASAGIGVDDRRVRWRGYGKYVTGPSPDLSHMR